MVHRTDISDDGMRSHLTLSVLYPFLTRISGRGDYHIREVILSEKGFYRVFMSKGAGNYPEVSVKIIVSWNNNFLESLSDIEEGFAWEGPVKSEKTHRILALSDLEGFSGLTADTVVPISLWKIDHASMSVRRVSGPPIDDHIENLLNGDYPNAYQNYPLPYVRGVGHDIRLSFLTQNFTLRGKHLIQVVLSQATDFAMLCGVNLKREDVLGDMNETLNILIKTGIFRREGEYVSAPRSRRRAEDLLRRRLKTYLERHSRRTLYDFV